MAEPLDPAKLSRSATWLAQAYDPPSDMVRFVAMAEQDYREASFLDDRMFQQWRDVRTLPFPVVQEAMRQAGADRAGWIFHIGHVGSTLIARMLGDLVDVLSVREPRILRDLTVVGQDRREVIVPTIRSLLSRTLPRQSSVVVKATSFVSEIAPSLMSRGAKALFLSTSPRLYIQTILAGENSRKELHHLLDLRARRMGGRVPPLGPPTDDAAAAAMAWACEATSLEAAAASLPDGSVRWLDFDDFLRHPAPELAACAGHFGIGASAAQVAGIATGPLLHRYSKDLSFDYSPSLRSELLSDAGRRNAKAIDVALALLTEAANHSPLLERALARFARKD